MPGCAAEVPPGPPVLATLLAEVYGPTAEARRDAVARLRDVFRSVDFIVDVDDSLGRLPERVRLVIDQEGIVRAVSRALHRVAQVLGKEIEQERKSGNDQGSRKDKVPQREQRNDQV